MATSPKAITIEIDDQDPANYIAECRLGLTRTLKSRAKLPVEELTNEDQTAAWYLLDLLERLDVAASDLQTN